MIAQKADILRKVCAAYDEALKIMHEEPAKGIAVMAKEFPRLSPEDNAAIYNAMLPTWPKDGKMDVEQAKRTMAYMTALGELEAKDGFDLAKLFTNKLQK